MSPDTSRIPGFQAAPGKRELTVYDTPPRRTADDEARDKAKHEESHPFLYYLGQAVPGLRPDAPIAMETAAEDMIEAGDTTAAASGLAAMWSPTASDRLWVEPREAPGIGATGLTSAQAQPAFPIQPAQPGNDETPVEVATPAGVPRLVFAHVQRTVQHGEPATHLVVQLKPEHLGRVELAFTYAQQKVTVNVVAATQQARDQLEGQLGQIRAILHAHHIQTGELKVVLGGKAGPQGGGTDRDPGEQPPRPRRRRRSALAGEAIEGV